MISMFMFQPPHQDWGKFSTFSAFAATSTTRAPTSRIRPLRSAAKSVRTCEQGFANSQERHREFIVFSFFLPEMNRGFLVTRARKIGGRHIAIISIIKMAIASLRSVPFLRPPHKKKQKYPCKQDYETPTKLTIYRCDKI